MELDRPIFQRYTMSKDPYVTPAPSAWATIKAALKFIFAKSKP